MVSCNRLKQYFLGAWVLALPAWGQVTVSTGQYDLNRTGANLAETTLTPANVNTGQFGLLFSRTVDHYIYAQPLYVPGVIIPPATTPVNVVYIATLNNSVYAFDADNPAATAPLWQVSLGPTIPIRAPALSQSMGPVCGIMSTPVIDISSGTMYVVAMTLVSGQRNFQLHALDITTGAEKFGGPVLIQAKSSSQSPDGKTQPVPFRAHVQYQRPALLLNNGSVWVMFAAGLSETKHFHGWAIAYNAATLQQVSAWCATPNGRGGGIWMSGRGAAADSNGVYFDTGNGSVGTGHYSQSVIRLSGATVDYFTPDNFAALNRSDWDLAASGPLLMPNTDLLVTGGKAGVVYVMKRDNLGHRQTGNKQIVQTLKATPGCTSPVTTSCNEIHAMTYWARTKAAPLLYIWGRSDKLRSFTQTAKGTFEADRVNPTVVNFPGGITSLSANGDTNGILWAVTNKQDSETAAAVPGILHAMDAVTLKELWNSDMDAADTLGNAAKFCIPMVANGKVYAATFSNQLMVYGPKGAAVKAHGQ